MATAGSCFMVVQTHEKLEELERLRDRPPAELVPSAATATPLVSVEKVESIAATVQELASGAGGLGRRQATLENRCVRVCVCARARARARPSEREVAGRKQKYTRR